MALQSSLHEWVVPLRDDRVQDQIGAFGQMGHVLDVAGIDVHGRRLAGAPGRLDLLGPPDVPVAEDDLVDRRMLGQVPGENVSLLTGADDDDFHGSPPEDSNQPVG